MAKDPAVLFYSKDWLEGTAEMFPEEKGVFIDLLCHQHQKGSLPNDARRLARMVGLSVQDFEKIWEELKDKFVTTGSLSDTLSKTLNETDTGMLIGNKDSRLVNVRMLKETVTRKKTNTKKSVQAFVSNWFRYDELGKTIKKGVKEKMLKSVNYELLINNNSNKEEIHEHLKDLAERHAKRSQYADANANEDVNKNEKEKGGAGEKTEIDQKFLKSICEYFSQTGEDREMKVWSFLKSLKNRSKLEEFQMQTIAYMSYKNLSKETSHSWLGYQAEWETSNWRHKLSKLKKSPKKMDNEVKEKIKQYD